MYPVLYFMKRLIDVSCTYITSYNVLSLSSIMSIFADFVQRYFFVKTVLEILPVAMNLKLARFNCIHRKYYLRANHLL